MPTKPNRAGQQQNYVPKGNGDASGEYGDNATGSNKHFTNFKKPDETQQVEEVKVTEQPKVEQQTETTKYKDDFGYEWENRQKYDFYLSLITSGIMSSVSVFEEKEDFIKKLKEVINDSNENSLNAIAYTMKNSPCEFTKDRFEQGNSYYYPMMNQIHIEQSSFDRGFEKQGTSLFHEIGHYINDRNKVHENIKWYSHTVKMTDAQTLFDDGKSLADTLQEELQEFSASKVASKIRKDKEKYVNEQLKQYGFTMKDYENLTKELKYIRESEEWQKIQQKIKDDYDNGKYGSVSDANKDLRNRFQMWKEQGPYRHKYSQLDKWRPMYIKATSEWFSNTGIHAVSDVWSSKSDFGFGLGHSREYYKKSYKNPNPQSLLADEFFANVFGAYSVGGEQALETTKKYFPRSYDKVLKLVEYVKTKGQKV